jgi:hypothetical protein
MPTAAATSFVAHLSIAIAPARTSDPVCGTPSSSSSPAIVPSSPFGPCSIGMATSHFVIAPTALAVSSAPPARLQPPSGPMVNSCTRYRARSSAAATAAADASDTSCSGLRPPPITATSTTLTG